jgi:hypothetical protein
MRCTNQVSAQLASTSQENTLLKESKLAMEGRISELQNEQETRTDIIRAYEIKMNEATQQLIHMKDRLEEAMQVCVHLCASRLDASTSCMCACLAVGVYKSSATCRVRIINFRVRISQLFKKHD